MSSDFEFAMHERAKDAAKLKEAQRRVAAVYMIGYAVECALKATLQRMGKRFPTSGRAGHNLTELFEAIDLKATDLHGEQRAFALNWDTSWRYLGELPQNLSQIDLYKGAIGLYSYILRRLRNTRKRR